MYGRRVRVFSLLSPPYIIDRSAIKKYLFVVKNNILNKTISVGCWNVNWATSSSKRGRFFQALFNTDLICVTEGYESLLPRDGYIIASQENYGYKTSQGQRKVILWSKEKWDDIDNIGSIDMPSGRYIAGTTMGIRFIGVCIPWKMAHVSTGRKDRRQWEDHLSFINKLSFRNNKFVLLGDFNQHIPPIKQPSFVSSALIKKISKLKVITSGIGLDHIVVSEDLNSSLVKIISTEGNSDHDGITCRLNFSKR